MENKIRLSDTVMKELEAIILNMKPGDKLPTEMELAERFSVGRSTIRECMKVFSARKMIVRRNEGTFVSSQVKECLVDPLNILVSMDIGNLTELIELAEAEGVRDKYIFCCGGARITHAPVSYTHLTLPTNSRV